MANNLEVARFRDAESAQDLSRALTESGIPCTVSSTAPAFDISSVGRGAVGEYLVVVQGEANELLARRAMLDGDRLVLKAGVAEDHHLREFDSDGLREIVEFPREWSPYDVAAAEVLLTERGEAFDPAEYKILADDSPEVVEKKKILSEGQWILAIIISVLLVKLFLNAMKY